jgi:DNA-binding NarL/FixJ family response regulator
MPAAILIADIDKRFRAETAALLEGVGYRTLQVASGADVLAAVARHEPRLVMLDVRLPDVNGYEVCRELRDRYGQTLPIVFVSGERTEAVDRAAGFLIGGDDYLVKPIDSGELVARVRRLLERPRGNGPAPANNGKLEALTPREREILGLLAHGGHQEDIAAQLVISPKTVATHIQRILGKLEVRNRAQAVSLALREEQVDVAGHVLAQASLGP